MKARPKDKDKIFLVIYLNIRNIDSAYVSQYINDFAIHLNLDETVRWFIIPVRDEESRMECINPVFLDEEQYKKVEEMVKTAQDKLNELLKDNE